MEMPLRAAYDVERRSALVVRLFRAPVLVASGEEMSEEACAGMIEIEPFKDIAFTDELVKERIPRRFGFDPMRDIQVLCP